VGIGTPTPSEKLDVNGSINITGTIKTNGVDGTPNQVLMKNGSGSLSWGNMTEFKNLATFTAAATGNWVVPANTNRIWVEVWGGGGGGAAYSGGGGGGYVMGLFTVTPGDNISFTVGSGGPGSSTTATNGNNSLVTVGSVTLTALGGQGAASSGGVITSGSGGFYTVTAGFTNFWGMRGGQGTVRVYRVFSTGSTDFQEGTGGNGGNAANAPGTGGAGRYLLYNTTAGTTYLAGQPEQGMQPGGGGGSGLGGIGLPTTGVGVAGGTGMVIIHY
jgi:trimeric autotransporter adhesin